MTNSTCPYCGEEVLLAAIWNQRNDKWTVLPLQGPYESPDTECDFWIPDMNELHEAVDIMGNVVGEFPVAQYTGMLGTNRWRTHNPSHYLEAH